MIQNDNTIINVEREYRETIFYVGEREKKTLLHQT